MIYIDFVDLHSVMFHAKFQNHRPTGSEEDFLKNAFAIYSHNDHHPLGTKCFFKKKHRSSVHFHTQSKFPTPFNNILLIFPIQLHG